MLPILLLCKRYAPIWRNKKILILSDNVQVVALINKGRGINDYCMQIVRYIFWESALYNFHLVSSHIKGLSNVTADYLSRIGNHGRIFKANLQLCCSQPSST